MLWYRGFFGYELKTSSSSFIRRKPWIKKLSSYLIVPPTFLGFPLSERCNPSTSQHNPRELQCTSDAIVTVRRMPVCYNTIPPTYALLYAYLTPNSSNVVSWNSCAKVWTPVGWSWLDCNTIANGDLSQTSVLANINQPYFQHFGELLYWCAHAYNGLNFVFTILND